MLSRGRIPQMQGLIQILLSRRKVRVIMVPLFLGGIYITILQCYGWSPTEIPGGLYELSASWHGLASSTSSNNSTIVGESTVNRDETPASLIDWMESTGFTTHQIPFISIADSKYIQALRNLRARLDRWNHGKDLIVICLDVACTIEDSFKGYGGFISQDGGVMNSVALIKFQINLELSKNGYDFVFLDGDVYFTGSRDPFEDMLPLSDNTWDVQFQFDQVLPRTGINIGWYFSRATPATIDFYERSNKYWTENHLWDQRVMNDILPVMETEEKSLKVHRLRDPRFQNWMLNDWQNTLFGNETTAAEFIQEASIIHYTCVEQDLKEYFGSNFGGFGDVADYYSKPPPLLAVSNITGFSQSILSQVAFAARLANATGRTLIWPDSVAIIQNKPDFTRYHPTYPGVRAISYASAQEAGLKTVEGRYLFNREAQIDAEPLMEVILNATQLISDGGPTALEAEILSLDGQNVAVIDFSSFETTQWLREFIRQDPELQGLQEFLANQSSIVEESFQEHFAMTGITNYSAPFLEQIKVCRNANNEYPKCLHVCD